MNALAKYLIVSFWMFLWIFGVILAKGFCSTWGTVVPFWAWYLSIEHFATKFGWL